MAEEKTKLEVFEIRYACDKCGEGYMEPTGQRPLTYPAKYPHACNNCGARKTFRNKYPAIRYGSPNEKDGNETP